MASRCWNSKLMVDSWFVWVLRWFLTWMKSVAKYYLLACWLVDKEFFFTVFYAVLMLSKWRNTKKATKMVIRRISDVILRCSKRCPSPYMCLGITVKRAMLCKYCRNVAQKYVFTRPTQNDTRTFHVIFC